MTEDSSNPGSVPTHPAAAGALAYGLEVSPLDSAGSVDGLPQPPDYFVRHLHVLALSMRAAVLGGVRATTPDELASVVGERGGDLVYRLDEHGEGALLEYCARWGDELPFMLVAEWLEGGRRAFPGGADASRAAFTLIVDPIDGTRGLMYGKRSAWALFGIAPAHRRSGAAPTLADISVALRAELPTARAALADVLWAVRSRGAHGETQDLRTGAVEPFNPRPSKAETLTGDSPPSASSFPGRSQPLRHWRTSSFSSCWVRRPRPRPRSSTTSTSAPAANSTS